MIRAARGVAVALALLACSAVAASAPPGSAPATAQSTMHTGGTLPPRSVLAAMPDFSGIGPLRFGMTPQQMRDAWGLPLHGEAPAGDPKACHYLLPQAGDHALMFMVEADRFVRIDVKTPEKTAPGGGRVGMSGSRIDKLYAGRVTAMPGKYDPAVAVLSVTSPQHPHAKLIFETDAAGKVTAWRIGIVPQVDHVEGCG